ncbi:hypothetical protein HMY34_11845 [Thiothrix subterranea]|uniref:hypothetical protein n=1 Tax=Thiothrix subterranea TaxID=2735563 RepID=UPI00192BFD72|nr:hypothetical protein [Thiothrix subterranea]QQZ29407.1 hypothetical protein HMY34_11845 [Thiothrix subterranea]
MKKLFLLVTIATLSLFYFSAQAEEKAATSATEAEVVKPAVTEQVETPAPTTKTDQAAAPAAGGEKKAEGEAAVSTDAKPKEEKKAAGGDEPDCN